MYTFLGDIVVVNEFPSVHLMQIPENSDNELGCEPLNKLDIQHTSIDTDMNILPSTSSSKSPLIYRISEYYNIYLCVVNIIILDEI